MNFTSASDFQYVTGANIDATHPHGDLDRIEIDNDILPVRTGDAKKKLRGMDIAFLMEAVEERARAVGLEEKEWEFSKNQSVGQVNEIISRFNELLGVDWTNKSGVFLKHDIEHYAGRSPINEYDFNYQQEEYLDDYAIDEITSDNIKSSDIETLFTKIGNMRYGFFDMIVFNGGFPKHYVHTNVRGEIVGNQSSAVRESIDNNFTYHEYCAYNYPQYARAYAFSTSCTFEISHKKLPSQLKDVGKNVLILIPSPNPKPDVPNFYCVFDTTRRSGTDEYDIVSYEGSQILTATRTIISRLGNYFRDNSMNTCGAMDGGNMAPYYEIANRTRWDIEEQTD